MHKYILYTAFGWLALTGALHFIVDVVSQYMRGVRAPGVQTTLYYGLHSAFSLGQVAFGLFALFLIPRAMHVLNSTPVLTLSLAAGVGWFATTLFFMEYWEPKFNVGIFCALILAAFMTR